MLEENLSFGAPSNPVLLKLEDDLKRKPDDANLLRRIAQMYANEGNPHRAASYLKRYLRVQPADQIARNQLIDLVGEDTQVPAPTSSTFTPVTQTQPQLNASDFGLATAAPAPSAGPATGSTAAIMAGVQTGGFKATVRAGESIGAPACSAPTSFAPPASSSPQGTPVVALAVALGIVALVVIGVVKMFGSIGEGMEAESNKLGDGLAKIEERQERSTAGIIEAAQRPLFLEAEQKRKVMDYQGAIEAYNFALAADPDLKTNTTAEALLGRGECHAELGHWRQAESDLLKVKARTIKNDALHEAADKLLERVRQR